MVDTAAALVVGSVVPPSPLLSPAAAARPTSVAMLRTTACRTLHGDRAVIAMKPRSPLLRDRFPRLRLHGCCWSGWSRDAAWPTAPIGRRCSPCAFVSSSLALASPPLLLPSLSLLTAVASAAAPPVWRSRRSIRQHGRGRASPTPGQRARTCASARVRVRRGRTIAADIRDRRCAQTACTTRRTGIMPGTDTAVHTTQTRPRYTGRRAARRDAVAKRSAA